jgi:hypothetical protein
VKNTLLDMPVEEERFRSQDAVILAAPDGGLSAYLSLTRRRFGRSAPRACWTLSLVPVGYTLVRTRSNAFSIRFHGAHTTLSTLAEQLFRDRIRQFHIGQVIQAGALRVTIGALLDTRPKVLNVEFDRDLEDDSLLFLYPTLQGYQRVRLPALGDNIVVPPPGAYSLPDELIAGD